MLAVGYHKRKGNALSLSFSPPPPPPPRPSLLPPPNTHRLRSVCFPTAVGFITKLLCHEMRLVENINPLFVFSLIDKQEQRRYNSSSSITAAAATTIIIITVINCRLSISIVSINSTVRLASCTMTLLSDQMCLKSTVFVRWAASCLLSWRGPRCGECGEQTKHNARLPSPEFLH